MLDLLFKNGHVLDGLGGTSFQAAVGVDGDEITVLRGDSEGIAARRSIDITGMTVAPGFIDMHSHSGLMILEEPTHEAKVRQGVTTEVIGVDGNSYAPFKSPAALWDFVRLNAGLDGRPDLDYEWSTVASYLERLNVGVAVNLAMLIGNSALRIATTGWDARPATQNEVADMRSILREGMEEGAFGLSSGLDYPPGSHATTEELAALSEEATRLGGIYHTHVRYQLGDRYVDPFHEAIRIGEASGCPVHITHLYRRASFPGGSAPLLDLVDKARASGLDVTFDTYPYEWSSTRLLILLPLWVQAGTPDEILTRLQDEGLRDQIRRDVDARGESYVGRSVWGQIRLGYFHNPVNHEFEGATLQEVMETRDQHPADAIITLLLTEDLAVNEVAPGPHGPSMSAFLGHPAGMIGSDSVFLGSHPSPRTYGTFPRVLGEFVRDERVLGLPEAVRKMTSFPASRLGLHKRGQIMDGFKADLVVFDHSTVKANATYEDPKQFPDGIHHVAVNGQLVVDSGRATGATPGRSLRRGRSE